ncbi:MAG: hypothetical protein ACFFDQ_12325 [Candidatus Thorarchaeota archaeon]
MAEMSSITSETSTLSQSGEKIGELAGLGSILGIVAAVFGLLIGKSLVPISALRWEVPSSAPFVWRIEGTPIYWICVSTFMGLLAASLLLQAIGSRGLGNFLGSGSVNVTWVGFILAAATAFIFPTLFFRVIAESLIREFWAQVYFVGALFVITWQLISVIYTDSSKTWIGFLAGTLNALFIPILAIGQAISPLLIYVAYGILLLGQLMAVLFWWAPFDTIREYARSTDKAKIAFGFTGIMTFVLGLSAVFFGPIGVEGGIEVWRPWSTLSNPVTYQTNPALVLGLVSLMLYWIMLAPRLGARELKAAAIGEDIIKGGNRWFMFFLAILGIISAGQAGAFVSGVNSWAFFTVTGPAGIIFLMGAAYTAKTDMITGVPMVITGIFLLIHPFVLLPFILIPWILVIITQGFLLVETRIRGLTGFSQASLTVIISLVSSTALIMFLLGGFGSGPLALWPTNRWFNIGLLQNIPAAIQGPLIIALPLTLLLLRNVSLAGYSYGRGYATGGVLVGASVLFSFLIPAIAGNQSAAHQANTGAALLLALYSIGIVLVISLNLNLANDLEDKGKGFESSLIKVASIVSLLVAAVVVIMILVVFAGMPTPQQIALMVSIMVTFVVSSEILSIIGWLFAGFRFGMLKEGFKFKRLT